MNRRGTFCGCLSRCWCCGVRRIAPDKAGKGKVLRPCIWIALQPIENCQNQDGHRVSDRCIDGPEQLFFGLSFGLIDRNRDPLVDALLSDDQQSLPSFLWLLGVARLPRGAISDAVHTSIGRRLVHRDLFSMFRARFNGVSHLGLADDCDDSSLSAAFWCRSFYKTNVDDLLM